MLYLSRQDLDSLKEQMAISIMKLTDRKGLKVAIMPPSTQIDFSAPLGSMPGNEQLEVASLQALSLLASLFTGEVDAVFPSDVHWIE